jgi:hypothetical protein
MRQYHTQQWGVEITDTAVKAGRFKNIQNKYSVFHILIMGYDSMRKIQAFFCSQFCESI